MSRHDERVARATTASMQERESKGRLRVLLFGAIGLLFLLSIPWYREANAAPPLLFGLPSWVAVAIGCYLGAACLNAIAWWIVPLSDHLPAAAEAGDDAARSRPGVEDSA